VHATALGADDGYVRNEVFAAALLEQLAFAKLPLDPY